MTRDDFETAVDWLRAWRPTDRTHLGLVSSLASGLGAATGKPPRRPSSGCDVVVGAVAVAVVRPGDLLEHTTLDRKLRALAATYDQLIIYGPSVGGGLIDRWRTRARYYTAARLGVTAVAFVTGPPPTHVPDQTRWWAALGNWLAGWCLFAMALTALLAGLVTLSPQLSVFEQATLTAMGVTYSFGFLLTVLVTGG
ncbi:hypothetical protein [Natronomonas sp. EA1]|uniref:hypothetical protein n=1 Tax=Natronomonas sp. EA1 TaxID=3421655 RepID=UPI003EBF35F8